jgi:hypothetical protein
MTWKAGVLSVALLLAPAAPLPAQDTPALCGCLPGDKIDGSTAEQAKAKIEAAGYTEVKILRKGCDNFWHGTGVYAGVPGNVVLAPDGQVMPEGD